MTPLVVMNEPLVTRVMDNVIMQGRVPSLSSSCVTRLRFPEAHKARKERREPSGIHKRGGQETGTTIAQFVQYQLVQGLFRFGSTIHPKRKTSRFNQIGSSFAEASRFHSTQRFNRTGSLGSGVGQAAGRKNLRRPFFRRRPSCRRSVAPIGFRALPRGPGLFGAEVLVRVVHQRIEPALRSCFGKKVSNDPLLQRFPKRKIVLSFSDVASQETRATGLQGGPDDLWKLICSFSDGANPQNEHVPFRESRRALCQLMPRHQEGPLHGSLLAVATCVDNEVCGISFRHPRPVSGGGRWDCWSEHFHGTNSSAPADERNRPSAVG